MGNNYKTEIESKIPYFNHSKVQAILADKSITLTEKANAIYKYAFDYASLCSDGRVNYPIPTVAIESLLLKYYSA